MPQFPLARFLDRFGIAFTVIIALVVSIGIVGGLLSSWKGLGGCGGGSGIY
jgi:hypothetical protein